MSHRCISTFSKASATLHQASALHDEMALRLMDHMAWSLKKPTMILDVGSGLSSQALHDAYPDAWVMGLDASLVLCQKHPAPVVCAYAEALPCANQSFDAIVGNAVLHWLQDPQAFFKEVQRVLKPEGVLFLSTFGPDTLCEAREVFAKMDAHPHINPLIDMHDWGDQLRSLGFKDPVLDRQRLTLTFPSGLALLRYLKAMGSSSLLPYPGLFTPRQARRFDALYGESSSSDGRVSATFELVFIQAWAQEVPRDYAIMHFTPKDQLP